MSDGKRRRDYRRLTAAIACGVILLAGLAAITCWHRPFAASRVSPLQKALVLSARIAQPPFAAPSQPPAISHLSKRRPASDSAPSELRAAFPASPALSPVARAQAMKTYAALPLRFEANQGQADSRVKFLSHGQGYTLFLTQNEAVLSVMAPARDAEPAQIGKPSSAGNSHPQAATLRVKFSGAAGTARATGKDLLGSQTNYFLGNDPKKWHTGVPNYAAVEYRGLYPGIDAVFHGNRQQFEFDFDVAPGADISKAELEVEGSSKPRLDAQGNIVLSVADRTEVTLDKPKVYQEIAGRRREIAGNFVLRNGNRIGFSVGDYDRSLPLVIDPTFTFQYSTYIGGLTPGVDTISGVAIGPSNHAAYLVGTTSSSNFPATTPSIPTSNAYQSTCETCSGNTFDSAFVAKFDQNQNLIYYTYLGPENSSVMPDELGEAYGYAIAVDASGDAYVTGQSTSQYFPTTANSLTFPTSGQPAFITELSDVVNSTTGAPQQQQLLNSTFLGGTGRDQGNAIALDNLGNIDVVGTTSSANLQTAGAVQSTSAGEYATFLAQINFNSTPSILNYYTYLLGSVLDAGTAVAVDASGNVWAGGYTIDPNPPAVAAMTGNTGQTIFPAASKYVYAGFVAKLNITPTYSSSLLYFSYLGGIDTTDSGIDGTQILALALDSAGNAYATGTTNEPDLATASGAIGGGIGATPTVCVGSGKNACPQGFVAEFNPNSTNPDGAPQPLLTYFGGRTPSSPVPFSPNTTGNGIALDAFGDIFVTGSVTTEDFPETGTTPGAAQTYQAYQGTLPCLANIAKSLACESAFLVEFPPGVTSVLYSTYLGGASGGPGGSTKDFATGIALDSSSNVYLGGNETSSSFPTTATPLIGTAPDTYEHGFFSVFDFPSGPLVQVSPPIANFGSTPPGQAAPPIILIVSNGGTGTLAIESVTVTSGPFSVVPGFCTGTSNDSSMPHGSYCLFTLSFTPTNGEAAGLTVGSLTIVDNAPQGVPDPVNAGEYDQTYNLEVSYGTAPTLSSISVTPANASIAVGGTEQYAAMGTFSDNSVQNLTNSVSWGVSSTSGAATISANVATGQNVGIATISASEYGVTGTTSLTVTQAATNTSLVPSPASASYGQPVTLTATVTSTSNGLPVTSGTVTFTDGSTTLAANVQPASAGTFTFTTSSLPVGTQQLSATYNPSSANFGSSTSLPISLTITEANTTTTLAVSPAGTLSYGQLLTLTASVTANGSPVTSGSVTFYDEATVLQSDVALNSQGQAIYPTAALSAGSHSLSAMYIGMTDYSSSSSTTTTGPVILVITPALTNTSLVSSPSGTVAYQTSVTLTANVSSGGLPLPGVTVYFLDGTTNLGAGTSPTDVNGNATYTSSTFSAGPHSFQAGFLGNTSYEPSTSTVVALTVTGTSEFATYLPVGPIQLGTVNIGSTTPSRQIIVQNTGTGSLTIVSAALAEGASSPFSVTPTCNGVVLAPTQSCTFTVQFTPAVYGLSQQDFLQIVDSATPGNSNVAGQIVSTGTQRNITLQGNAALTGHGQLTTIAGSTADPLPLPPNTFLCNPTTAPLQLCNAGFLGDGGLATQAQLWFPTAVAVSPKDGTIYIADDRNLAIRAINPTTGNISTIATDTTGADAVTAVAVDSAGNVYYGDQLGFIFENGVQFVAIDNASIEALTTDSYNNLYVLSTVAGSFERITMYASQGNSITFADTSQDVPTGFLGASLYGIAADPSGCNAIMTTGTCSVYTYGSANGISASNQIIEITISLVCNSSTCGAETATTVSPSNLVSGGQTTTSGLVMDPKGNFYILNEGGNYLQAYTPSSGALTILAGTGVSGYNNYYYPDATDSFSFAYNFDGPFPATQTYLNAADGLAIDSGGNIYIADTANNLVRKFVDQPITPLIDWPTPSPITYPALLSSTQLDATAVPSLPATLSTPNIPGTYAYTPPSGTMLLPGPNQPLSVIFTPTDTADFAMASGSTTITVNQASSTLLIASPAVVPLGGGVTLTATVSPAPGDISNPGPPTGTVTFLLNGSTPLGPPVSLSGGVATLILSTLPLGTDSITASYSGDTNFTASTSPAQTVQVTPAPEINFAGPAAFFSTGSLGFNGQSGAQPLTVWNVGEGPLVLSGAPISPNPGPFTITQTVCLGVAVSLPATLPYGGSCVFTISYTPLGMPANDTGAIVFADNAALSSPASTAAGGSFTQTISLNGAGMTSPTPPLPSATVTIPAITEPITVSDQVAASPVINFAGPAAFFSTSSLGFNGQSGAQPLTVWSVGEGSLMLSGAVISPSPGPFTITQTVCSGVAASLPTTLPTSYACTFTISYTPSGTPSNDTGTIVFTDNAALSSPASTAAGGNYTQSISLSGGAMTAAPPALPSATVTIPTITEPITVTDTPAVSNTLVGADVVVTPVDTTTGATPVTLTFSNVTQPGVTSLTTSPTGPAAPAGFQLGNPPVYYNLSTTANYAAPITICINYTGITFTQPPQLFHYQNGMWANITLSVNLTTMIVCGTTNSLSPFALFQPSAAPTTASMSAAGITYGNPGSVTVSVSSASGTVTGNVSLTVDGGTASTLALTKGSAVFNLGILNAATHTLSASFAAQGNFLASSAAGTLSVAQAPLTIAADNATRVYGGANPTLTASYAGFVNGDSAAVLIGTLSCSTVATPASPVGNYPIVCNGQSAANYSITYLPGQLTVTPATPAVTVMPSSSGITTVQPFSVTVAVSGVSGNPAPTGTVTLTSGSYTSAAATLSSGSATITVPAGSLATGTDLLTANYAGNANYSASSGTASVTVTTPLPPSFTVTGTAVTVSPGATTGNTSTVTVTPGGGFTGNVTLTAAVTSSPAGGQDPPTLSFGTTSPVSITGTTAGTAALTISTTAATNSASAYPRRHGIPWYAAGGATLACLLLFGIPAQRRRWQTVLGMLALFVALSGGLLACGGGFKGGGGTSNPGTTAGSYTITVTATSGAITETGTVTLTVQ
jgi:Bacterial Ig-like domain (group 3)/MBG domain (YGX type)/Abnormal spindle-like microcephaly-assoc'd, ASPM-SPD-2-Hydin/Beta-propeller repeat/NHL repeat